MKAAEYAKYISMIALVFGFFLVELIVGIVASSITLQTDSFHMLSDVFAIIIAFVSAHLKTRDKSTEYTYGFLRSEIIGGLINSVFLLSTCFYLTLEVIHKFIDLSQNSGANPVLEADIIMVLGVGGGGLLINVIGLFLFHNFMHHHNHGHGHEEGHVEEHSHNDSSDSEIIENAIVDHNKMALLLHIFGDFLGSIVVIGTGLVIKYTDWSWKFYLDPIGSVVVIIIIMVSSIKLFKSCINILLHQVPKNIDLAALNKEILAITSVEELHEFHLWSLTNNIVIASLHVRLHVDSLGESDSIIGQIKNILHKYNIHSSSIQPEWAANCMEPICKNNCYQCCENLSGRTDDSTQVDIVWTDAVCV